MVPVTGALAGGVTAVGAELVVAAGAAAPLGAAEAAALVEVCA
ncbi:MAG: hypothetical protein WDO13_16995 [Verrucomicrobiota bacterium]